MMQSFINSEGTLSHILNKGSLYVSSRDHERDSYMEDIQIPSSISIPEAYGSESINCFLDESMHSNVSTSNCLNQQESSDNTRLKQIDLNVNGTVESESSGLNFLYENDIDNVSNAFDFSPFDHSQTTCNAFHNDHNESNSELYSCLKNKATKSLHSQHLNDFLSASELETFIHLIQRKHGLSHERLESWGKNLKSKMKALDQEKEVSFETNLNQNDEFSFSENFSCWQENSNHDSSFLTEDFNRVVESEAGNSILENIEIVESPGDMFAMMGETFHDENLLFCDKKNCFYLADDFRPPAYCPTPGSENRTFIPQAEKPAENSLNENTASTSSDAVNIQIVNDKKRSRAKKFGQEKQQKKRRAKIPLLPTQKLLTPKTMRVSRLGVKSVRNALKRFHGEEEG